MTADQVALLKVLVEILAMIKASPYQMMVALLVPLVGPWVLAVALFLLSERSGNRRLDAVVKMYENNVVLVEDYAKVCKTQASREDSLRDIILLNTQAMQRLADAPPPSCACSRTPC